MSNSAAQLLYAPVLVKLIRDTLSVVSGSFAALLAGRVVQSGQVIMLIERPPCYISIVQLCITENIFREMLFVTDKYML